MQTEEKSTPERAVEVLRATVREVEEVSITHDNPDSIRLLAADIALVASLLADHIEDLILGGDLPVDVEKGS